MSALRKMAPLALIAMLGCTQQQPAQIVFKGDNAYTQTMQMAMGGDASHAARPASNSAYAYPNAQPIESPAVMAAPIARIQAQDIQEPMPIAVKDMAQLAPAAEKSETSGFLPSNLFSADEREDQEMAKNDVVERPAPAINEHAMPMKSLTKVESPVSSPVAALAEMASTRQSNAPAGQYFSWPVHGEVISTFGQKPNGQFNDGINIAAPAGAPVKAVADGVVVYAGNELKGYGNMVIIRHDSGWMSAYAHIDELWAQPDDVVRQGDKIATVGATGNVEFAQLHFGLRKGRDAVDPTGYLARNVAQVQ